MTRMDIDLARMSSEDLREQVMMLRAGVRRHRDERGHGRCWLDDQRLYALLPEGAPDPIRLPPRDEFLGNCARYWEERQHPKTKKRRSGIVRRIGFLIARLTGVV